MKKENNLVEKETYIAPNIEVVKIEMEQNILLSGSGDSGEQLPGMPGGPW